jgi:hypothetical protein
MIMEMMKMLRDEAINHGELDTIPDAQQIFVYMFLLINYSIEYTKIELLKVIVK